MREMMVVVARKEKTDLLLLGVSLRLLRRVGSRVVPRRYVPPFQDALDSVFTNLHPPARIIAAVSNPFRSRS